MQFEKVKKEIINRKERFCAKSHIQRKKDFFFLQIEMLCKSQSKWKKLIKGFINVTIHDIMLKDRDLQNLFKGCRMGRSDKVSLWYVSLLINTRFRFFILE